MTKSRQLLEMIELLESLHQVDEIAPRRHVEYLAGKRTIKYHCPDGYKFDPAKGSCVRMTGEEQRGRERAGDKAALGSRGKRGLSIIKRARSMMKRKNQIGLR